jgi:hypothetical protein
MGKFVYFDYSFKRWTTFIPKVFTPWQVLTFKQKFLKDLLNQFIPRWQYPGTLTSSFGLVFGNYDVRVARRNLRYCAHAAYAAEGLERRALVRPWKVPATDHGEDTIENFKMKYKVYSPVFEIDPDLEEA